MDVSGSSGQGGIGFSDASFRGLGTFVGLAGGKGGGGEFGVGERGCRFLKDTLPHRKLAIDTASADSPKGLPTNPQP